MRTAFCNAVALLLSLAFCLLIGEICLRIFLPQQLLYTASGAWTADLSLGYTNANNVNLLVNTGERTVHFVTDSSGYRINPEDTCEGDEPGRQAILFLGDSYLQALAVENCQTVPCLLKQLLRERGWRVCTDNAGVNGWNPNHYLLQARKVLNQKRYDLGLVFLFLGNDCVTRLDTIAGCGTKIREVTRRHFRLPESAKRKELMSALILPINDFLEERSHLFVFLRDRSWNLLGCVGLNTSNLPDVFLTAERDSHRWQTVAQICDLIRGEFQSHGSEVLFVLLPANYQVYPDIFRDYLKAFEVNLNEVDLEQPNKLLARAFAEKSLPVLDPLDYMRQKAAFGERLYGHYDRHLSAQGHEAVSEFLLPYVEAILARSAMVEFAADTL